MYVYDIMANQVTEMNIYDIAEMIGRTPSSLSHAARRKSIMKPFNIAIFKHQPTVEEKREMYSMLTVSRRIVMPAI